MPTIAELQLKADTARIAQVRARMEKRLAEEDRRRREKACRKSGGHVYNQGTTSYAHCLVCGHARYISLD